MKFVIVTIRREMNPSLPRMRYPRVYDAMEVEVNKTGPLMYSEGLARGQNSEEMMMRLSDTLADRYAVDDDIRILTETEADAWLSVNPKVLRMPEERVTDVNRMIAIQAKVAAGIDLSPEDRDALDPNKPVRGINRKAKTAASLFDGT